MVVNLVLARHGQSEWHREDRYAGRSDVDLTDEGRREAAALARWAAGADVAAVWSSHQRRSRATAAPAAEVVGVPVRVDPRLGELDFGVAEGLTRTELAERFPDDLAAFQRDPVSHHFAGGEHPETAVARYLEAFADLARDHRDERVLVVAHSTVLRLTLCRLLSIDLAHYRRVMPALLNCGLTEVALHDDHAALLRFNSPLDAGVLAEEAP